MASACVVEVLTRLGGVASRHDLVEAVGSRAEVDRALAAGDVVVLARGRYALPAVDEARAAAHRLTGTVSHLSAALHWGWAVLTPPSRPVVTVPRNRRVTPSQARGVQVRWSRLDPAVDVEDGVTAPERTLRDCLRHLPFAEGLAVADSALRAGVPRSALDRVAREARGPATAQVRRVAGEASHLASGPFESALRAAALDVPGLRVEPQVSIHDPGFLGRPDLLDRRLRLVLEADSFAWHGSRSALAEDCLRYNALSVAGWLVLRFSYEEVVGRPHRVTETLRAAVAERAQWLCPGCCTVRDPRDVAGRRPCGPG
ncbi:DUF559 domain-containing protein [Nocardioides sp. Leaf374]|uniref:DUF559 domain-containing protein n=1 Tax=Nocardioides sp. Leaf374 TaxID=2876560 RepID=UPI001E64DD07|nr:DUF559 domain-containing protein [Nocardioides sp. Leaf374]